MLLLHNCSPGARMQHPQGLLSSLLVLTRTAHTSHFTARNGDLGYQHRPHSEPFFLQFSKTLTMHASIHIAFGSILTFLLQNFNSTIFSNDHRVRAYICLKD